MTMEHEDFPSERAAQNLVPGRSVRLAAVMPATQPVSSNRGTRT